MELSSVPTDAELLALAGEVGTEVRQRKLTLVTAESCTGGWIAKTLTDLPGSSAWFDAGVVTYSYEAKEALLGVNPRTLEHAGAVSEDPAGGCGAVVDDATAGRERCFDALLRVLLGHRHVDVHRVAQRLAGVEFLHPHRRAVAQRVDGVVVGERRVAQHGAPEPDVEGTGLSGDRDLHLVHRRPVRDGAVGARHR